MIAIALACALICAVTDLRTGLIYDAVTAPAASAIAVTAAFTHAIPAAFESAALCGGALLVLHLCTHGRGIGLGDVKLAGVIGAGVANAAALEAIAFAFVAGALWALPMLAARRVRRRDRVPFAPFLALGALAFACGIRVHG